MIITKTHADFYASKKTPKWARDIYNKPSIYRKEFEAIDGCINSHAAVYRHQKSVRTSVYPWTLYNHGGRSVFAWIKSFENTEPYNTLTILKSARKRGELLSTLVRLSINRQTVGEADCRRAEAHCWKWYRKIMKRSYNIDVRPVNSSLDMVFYSSCI